MKHYIIVEVPEGQGSNPAWTIGHIRKAIRRAAFEAEVKAPSAIVRSDKHSPYTVYGYLSSYGEVVNLFERLRWQAKNPVEPPAASVLDRFVRDARAQGKV